jgi:ubiquinone/menaquinone biosynthesis C-methylase UbiE
MNKESNYSDIVEYEKTGEGKHSHKGRSSESLLNKEVILRELDIRPGQTILDAGCGNGYMAREFSKLVNDSGKVYALDPDKESIEVLRQEAKGTNIVAIVGDITKKTQIEDSSIDLMYLSTVFHGFSKDQIEGFEKEVKRILKVGGKLAIVEIQKQETPFGPPLDMRCSPEDLREKISLTPKAVIEVGQYFYMQMFENLKE